MQVEEICRRTKLAWIVLTQDPDIPTLLKGFPKLKVLVESLESEKRIAKERYLTAECLLETLKELLPKEKLEAILCVIDERFKTAEQERQKVSEQLAKARKAIETSRDEIEKLHKIKESVDGELKRLRELFEFLIGSRTMPTK